MFCILSFILKIVYNIDQVLKIEKTIPHPNIYIGSLREP